MLHAILHELQTTKEPITLRTLSQKLHVQQSALAGMIQFWVQKGRLELDDGFGGAAKISICGGKRCARSCPGPSQCPLVSDPLTTYTLHSPKQ